MRRFPNALTLLVFGILIAMVLTWILPAGELERREDAATGRQVVVAGTYHEVPPQPVGVFGALLAIPRGLADAGSVVFLVFLAGGAFAVVDATGALRRGVDWLVQRLAGRTTLVIPIVSIVFATLGALSNTQEEIVALIPVLLVLVRRSGFDALTACAISVGAAVVGASFSPINPFQVGIAQKLAELPLLSGAGYRLIFLAIAVTIWIWGTLRHARRHRQPLEALDEQTIGLHGGRTLAVLAVVIVSFAMLVVGIVRLGWDFDQMSVLFFIMGVAAGLVGGLGVNRSSEAFIAGFRDMAFAAVLIGFARAISVVLEDGRVIDTIVQGMFTPLAGLPVQLAALGMMVAHTVVHLPVPSVSGHAVLTMPLLVPLSDLLELSRQVTVLAYQYGAGMTDAVTPTNGALMAVLAAAGVGYDRWLRFTFPLFALLLLLGGISVVVATLIGV